MVCSLDKDAPESVHLCDFPSVKEEWIDKELEADMEKVLEVVVLGRACRNSANIKQRQPIAKMYVKSEKGLDGFYVEIIEEELNVKKVIFSEDVSEFTSYSFKPQLRTLGKRFGKRIGAVKEALAGLDSAKAIEELNESDGVSIVLDGVEEKIMREDLLIEAAQKEGYVSATDRGVTVVLDTNLTEELIEEGFVREIISKVQTMRKDSGFEVMDKIVLGISGNVKIEEICRNNEEEIKRIVMADEIRYGEKDEISKEWSLNGEDVVLSVRRR